MVRNGAVEGRLSFSEQNDEGEVSEPVLKALIGPKDTPVQNVGMGL